MAENDNGVSEQFEQARQSGFSQSSSVPSNLTSPMGARNENGYTAPQIASMQRDAMRRVNEMQRIARERLHQTNPEAPIYPPQHGRQRIQQPQIIEDKPYENINNQQENIHTNQQEPILNEESQFDNLQLKPTPNVLKGIFDKLDLDDEKLILIGLIFLLINEGADNMLILALGYILL